MKRSPDWADHYSAGADAYRRFRPTYPAALFRYLAQLTSRHDLAWDCAAGTGQAAAGLLPHYRRVVATDASRGQIGRAPLTAGLVVAACRAEAASLRSGSADLIVVAQALHWFAQEGFFGEARRVARPGAVVAAWTYSRTRVSPEIDRVLDTFDEQLVGRHWPRERTHVDSGYRSIPFPFDELPSPAFTMAAMWTAGDVLGYVSTWSAVKRAREATGSDPMAWLTPRLHERWGEPGVPRTVTWPLHLRVGRVEAAAG